MGEYADMMLDGTCCSMCGVFLNDGADGDGFPVTCVGCGGDGMSAGPASRTKPRSAAEIERRKRARAKRKARKAEQRAAAWKSRGAPVYLVAYIADDGKPDACAFSHPNAAGNFAATVGGRFIGTSVDASAPRRALEVQS